MNAEYLLSALQAAKASVGGAFKQPAILEFRGPIGPITIKTNHEDVKMVLRKESTATARSCATAVRLLLALEDLTGMTFRELFGESEGRR